MKESISKRIYCLIFIEKNKPFTAYWVRSSSDAQGGRVKSIAVFLSMQEDEECLVLDGGHQELGHVSPMRKVEGDTGGCCLQTSPAGRGRTGTGAVRGWPWKAERWILVSTTDQDCAGAELHRCGSPGVRPARGTSGLAAATQELPGSTCICGWLGTAVSASAAAKSTLTVAREDEERTLEKPSEAELSNSALQNVGLSSLTVSQKNKIFCRKQ